MVVMSQNDEGLAHGYFNPLFTLRKKVQKPSLGLYLFKREIFCPFLVICTF